MHPLQQKILSLAQCTDVSNMGLRKLGRMIQEKYPQKVKHHLEQLEKKGLVKLDANKNRLIKILKKNKTNQGVGLFKIPIYGSANCGPADILAEQNLEGYLSVSPSILKNNKKDSDKLFAIRAVGNSLDQAKAIKGGPIKTGDYVIIDSHIKQPKDGDYVLSVIDGQANLKRFYQDSQEIRLVSESSLTIPPIVLHADDVRDMSYIINGVVVRVIKA